MIGSVPEIMPVPEARFPVMACITPFTDTLSTARFARIVGLLVSGIMTLRADTVPSFHGMLLSAMVAGVASWTFLSWLPLFFSENYGLKLGAAGLAGVALYKAPVLLGTGFGGWISDYAIRRDRRGQGGFSGDAPHVEGEVARRKEGKGRACE